MGKRKMIRNLEKAVVKLQQGVGELQRKVRELEVGPVSADWNEDRMDEKIGVSTPGVWRIRIDPKPGVKTFPLWWWNDAEIGDGFDGGEWRTCKEEAAEYTSLIEAVRNLETIKSRPKDYQKPVIVEPSGGIYNERDGRDPDAKAIEPLASK